MLRLACALLCVALALRRKHPTLDVRLIEGGRSIGGNHLWSFFASDVAPADRWLVVVARPWRKAQGGFGGVVMASLPLAPDLAVISTPPEAVPGLIAELGARGTKAASVAAR